MKTSLILSQAAYRSVVSFAALLALADLPFPVIAQLSVTTVYTHTVNATTSTSYAGTEATGNYPSSNPSNTYTYKFGLNVAAANNVTLLDSLKANSLVYHYQPASYSVVFRRVDNTTVTGRRKSFRIEQIAGTLANNGTLSLYPDYNDSLEQLFVQRIFNIGIDNVFQNANTTNNINIEREDVIFTGGLKATDNTKTGFAVFDWGASGGHDPFYIAAIKTLDGTGKPASYYSAVSITAASYGSGVGGSSTYAILRKNPADSRMLMMSSNTTQTRDGVFLRFSDLGVANNTLTYGYSIFGPDVTVSPVIKMVDYTNASNFPTNTDVSGGGFDPLAVAGLWVTDATFIVLPARIDELHTSIINDQVKLNWDLHQTGDLKEQVVERSGDGTNYSPVLQIPVQAAGVQTVIDTRPLSGPNYYRVKLVQQDGALAAYSTVSQIDVKPVAPLSIDVYPNPVKNHLFNLTVHGLTNGTYEIVLYDLNGRPAFHQSITGEPVLQASIRLPQNVASGTYVLRLTDKTGNSVFERHILIE